MGKKYLRLDRQTDMRRLKEMENQSQTNKLTFRNGNNPHKIEQFVCKKASLFTECLMNCKKNKSEKK